MGVDGEQLHRRSGLWVELVHEEPVSSLHARKRLQGLVETRRSLRGIDQLQPLGGHNAPQISADIGRGRMCQGARPAVGFPVNTISGQAVWPGQLPERAPGVLCVAEHVARFVHR